MRPSSASFCLLLKRVLLLADQGAVLARMEIVARLRSIRHASLPVGMCPASVWFDPVHGPPESARGSNRTQLYAGRDVTWLRQHDWCSNMGVTWNTAVDPLCLTTTFICE